MSVFQKLKAIFSRLPKKTIDVPIDNGYYDWLEKIVGYAPENEAFSFKNIILKILQEHKNKTILLYPEEREKNISRYNAEDIFYSLYAGGFIVPVEEILPDDVTEGQYYLTGKGRSLKQEGKWFEWHRKNKLKK